MRAALTEDHYTASRKFRSQPSSAWSGVAGGAPRPALGTEAFKRAAAACKEALAEALWPGARIADGLFHKSRHRAVVREFVARHVLGAHGSAAAGAGAR